MGTCVKFAESELSEVCMYGIFDSVVGNKFYIWVVWWWHFTK